VGGIIGIRTLGPVSAFVIALGGAVILLFILGLVNRPRA
jgi:uncharacterized membrane protein YeaQ/YmgE (transglycosylase-associated protein family)